MSATGYVDACGFIPVSSGTGDFVVSTAITGYNTPAGAGAVNATVYSYRAENAAKTEWEEGFGAYTVGSVTLARTTVTASSTGSKVSFTAAPNVFITAATADLQNAALLTSGTLPVARINGGTVNQLVQGDGTFQLQGRKLINTLTASNSATLSDTTSLTATFSEYEIEFENLLPATNNVTMELLVHSGGTFPVTSYIGNATGFSNGSVSPLAAAPTTFIQLGVQGSIPNTMTGLSGSMRVSLPSGTTTKKLFWGTCHYSGSTLTGYAVSSGYWNGGNGAIDGFQVLASAGNLTSGTVKIYGIG